MSQRAERQRAIWLPRFGPEAYRRTQRGFHVLWWATAALVPLIVGAIAAQIGWSESAGWAIVILGLLAYAIAATYAISEIYRATQEICRFNQVDPAARSRLSQRQLFRPDAFDAWLEWARTGKPMPPWYAS